MLLLETNELLLVPVVLPLHVVVLVFFVELLRLITQAAHGMELCHQVYVVFVVGVYYLVQPDDIWVFKALEHLELFDNAVVRVFAFAKALQLQLGLVHLFDGVLGASVGVSAQVHHRKAAFSQLLLQYVLVDLLLGAVILVLGQLQLVRRLHGLRPLGWLPLQLGAQSAVEEVISLAHDVGAHSPECRVDVLEACACLTFLVLVFLPLVG
jgi:hypothetical protein